MIFESHAHYNDSQFNKDREALFKEFQKQNIQYVINIGADMHSSRLSIELAKKYSFLFATVGVHPHDVGKMKEEDLERLIHLAAYEKVVAIGEIGLDYYYDNAQRSVQKLWFREQLKIAKELALPVVIHSREASQDTFDILMEANLFSEDEVERPKGVIHCYSGHAEMAVDYVNEGFMIGIGGVITFKNGKKLKEVVKKIPIESILVETDAPYLAPEPYRGKRNDSRYLKYIIEEIGKIKGISPKDVEDITYQNGKRLFFD